MLLIFCCCMLSLAYIYIYFASRRGKISRTKLLDASHDEILIRYEGIGFVFSLDVEKNSFLPPLRIKYNINTQTDAYIHLFCA